MANLIALPLYCYAASQNCTLIAVFSISWVQAVIFLANAWSCFDSGETLSEVVVDSVVEYLRQPTIRSIVEDYDVLKAVFSTYICITAKGEERTLIWSPGGRCLHSSIESSARRAALLTAIISARSLVC